MPALPPKPLPKLPPKAMPKPLAALPPKPTADLAPKPAPDATVAVTSELAPEAMQASFLIGPPGAPEDMKELYDRAGQQLKNGDDSLSKKLFAVRSNTIKYITLPNANQKPMLQKILEERLEKDLQNVEATIGLAHFRGDIIPNLTISLSKTLYADGSPIGTDLTAEMAKALESTFGVVFKAQWVQSTVR